MTATSLTTATSLSVRPSARPVSTSPLPAGTLLALARRGLVEAGAAATPGERYAAAHLSALRVAAAVLACRARPETGPVRRGRPTSAWVLLTAVAPELGEWAAFFAAGARTRAAAEAGRAVVAPREADDLLRDAQVFLAVVEQLLQEDVPPPHTAPPHPAPAHPAPAGRRIGSLVGGAP